MTTHAMNGPWQPADLIRLAAQGWRQHVRGAHAAHMAHGGPDDPHDERHGPREHGGREHGARGHHGGPRRGRRHSGPFGAGGPFGPAGLFGPGGPFGPSGPFGPDGPFGDPRTWGRHSFGGGPRARRGDVRAAALALLSERPMNGYQIIQEIRERSGGMWKPSSGSVYPALQQLEDEGLIEAGEHEGRRAFSLTEQGRQYVQDNAEELKAPWAAFDSPAGENAMELRELAGRAMGAFMQVVTTGTPQQVEQAKQVLNETRKALYRILAEDEPADDDRPDPTQ